MSSLLIVHHGMLLVKVVLYGHLRLRGAIVKTVVDWMWVAQYIEMLKFIDCRSISSAI